jgi:hypothetical protein
MPLKVLVPLEEVGEGSQDRVVRSTDDDSIQNPRPSDFE